MLEDASRVLTRKVLGRIPPAATAQRRAVVTFAQNEATARRLLGRGRLMCFPMPFRRTSEHVEPRLAASSDFVYAGPPHPLESTHPRPASISLRSRPGLCSALLR